MTRFCWKFVLSGLAATLCGAAGLGAAQADEVSVAVAANFTAPMKQIAQAFEKDSGHKVLASFGASGKFYAQIKNGAPFELLLAADEETPSRLVQEGLAQGSSQFTYALGKLVLWSPTNGLALDAAALKKGGFAHLALADPKLAPYGAAAVQTLRALGLYEALQAHIVSAENIGQTYQFVQSGNAELGFVALSQVLKSGAIEGSAWRVPEALYRPLRQDAVLLEKGRGKAAARDLLQYLRGDKARAIILSFGYALR
jgi:molybdate transport system substrate-binding protein